MRHIRADFNRATEDGCWVTDELVVGERVVLYDEDESEILLVEAEALSKQVVAYRGSFRSITDPSERAVFRLRVIGVHVIELPVVGRETRFTG